jgi:uncharacterized membrane protein
MLTTFFRPMAALMFASVAGCVLLALRSILLGHGRHLHLVWNLFLAWLPLFFALGLQWWSQFRSEKRGLGWWGLAAGWLLFFPNAPYILTDLAHLRSRTAPHYWTDLVLILVFALTGLVLGFVSLFVVQRLVARRFGWVAGWGLVGATTFLNGFGVYAGRFLRWNSWDVVFSPWSLLNEGVQWVASMPESPRGLMLPLLFAVLMFLAYVMLYGLTHMRFEEETPAFGRLELERAGGTGA